MSSVSRRALAGVVDVHGLPLDAELDAADIKQVLRGDVKQG